MRACVRACVCVCMCALMRACMCACMCTCACIQAYVLCYLLYLSKHEVSLSSSFLSLSPSLSALPSSPLSVSLRRYLLPPNGAAPSTSSALREPPWRPLAPPSQTTPPLLVCSLPPAERGEGAEPGEVERGGAKVPTADVISLSPKKGVLS